MESTMNVKHLCIIFWSTPTVCATTIQNFCVLSRTNTNSKIMNMQRWISNWEKMEQFAQMIPSQKPIAHNVIGFWMELHCILSAHPWHRPRICLHK
jgi:hypothetical protein